MSRKRPRPLDPKLYIRDIPDFPKAGIIFKDITPLLKSTRAFRGVIDTLANHYKSKRIDLVLAVDARGFLFASPLALRLRAGIIPMRKRGKLPYKTHSVEYQLEYGTDTVEIHQDAISAGDRVLIVDDVLATGGTARAAIELVTRSGGKVVECAFLIELTFLHGRDKLKPHKAFSIVRY
ncbi:MAG: adenine phosphoribosyltransferase [Nitrospirae bacterium]|nr:adenine phosphoribosyltransferase [Nitrospirota bacterium]